MTVPIIIYVIWNMAEKIVFEENTSTVLLKTYRSRNRLVERLKSEDNVDFVYGENLTREGEYVTSDLNEVAKRPENYLSLMLVRKKGRS